MVKTIDLLNNDGADLLDNDGADSTNKRDNISVKNLVIASSQFPGVYLRMDGRGVSQPTAAGGGTVNCQFGARSWERFNIIQQSDSSFAIESVAFSGVYLRMQGVNQSSGSGGGKVNCQFGARSLERFNIIRQPDFTFAIESTAYRGAYLRMDGQGVSQPTGTGGGTVNSQFGAASFEKFYIFPSSLIDS